MLSLSIHTQTQLYCILILIISVIIFVILIASKCSVSVWIGYSVSYDWHDNSSFWHGNISAALSGWLVLQCHDTIEPQAF